MRRGYPTTRSVHASRLRAHGRLCGPGGSSDSSGAASLRVASLACCGRAWVADHVEVLPGRPGPDRAGGEEVQPAEEAPETRRDLRKNAGQERPRLSAQLSQRGFVGQTKIRTGACPATWFMRRRRPERRAVLLAWALQNPRVTSIDPECGDIGNLCHGLVRNRTPLRRVNQLHRIRRRCRPTPVQFVAPGGAICLACPFSYLAVQLRDTRRLIGGRRCRESQWVGATCRAGFRGSTGPRSLGSVADRSETGWSAGGQGT